jgi:hypothetical protein
MSAQSKPCDVNLVAFINRTVLQSVLLATKHDNYCFASDETRRLVFRLRRKEIISSLNN